MDRAIEQRVRRRLGRARVAPGSRLDKACGNSFIPDDHECKAGPGKSTTAKQKSQPRQSLKGTQQKIGQRLAGTLIAMGIVLGYGAFVNYQVEKNRREMDERQKKRQQEYKERRKRYQDWYNNFYGETGTSKPDKTPWHETLGVSKDASPQEVKSAFRKLAKKHHPDTSTNKEDHAEFLKVSEAWERYVNIYGRRTDSLRILPTTTLHRKHFILARRTDASTIPVNLKPHIQSTLKTVYGNGVLQVGDSTINRDGEIEGVFVGRSRSSEPARVYTYGIDLVREQVRFKRSVPGRRDEAKEICCGGRKKKQGCECSACAGK
jgi:hypothetical protein